MNSNFNPQIAFFSMEFAVDARIPNYAGGLGVLAADFMNTVADQDLPVVGVSVIYHQSEDPRSAFHPSEFMTLLPERVVVQIEDRQVVLGAYDYEVESASGKISHILFLTSNFPENARWDRDLTKHLYPAHTYTRIGQQALFGIGGVRMLRALGYKDIKVFHMNEGHCALLTLELLRENSYDNNAVRKLCRFTTHTPVAAGHDYYDYALVHQIIGEMMPLHIKDLASPQQLSMTHLAMNLSLKTNSVAEKHQEVCREMFPSYQFENVTNGVHHLRWASAPMTKLFNDYLPGWQEDPELFYQAPEKLPSVELKDAHAQSKKVLIDWLNQNPEYISAARKLQSEDMFDCETLTIGFARRFVPYKRPTLIFKDLDRLRNVGFKKLQFVFSGRVHPDDYFASSAVKSIRENSRILRGQVKVAFVPNYNLDIAAKLISGVDVWLNNPIVPREASGTSGMKAALNGGLNLSILDGWWKEGAQKYPRSGWSFGVSIPHISDSERDVKDAESFYQVLEEVIDCFYNKPENWVERMKDAVALLGFFNTHRCLRHYNKRMWSVTE